MRHLARALIDERVGGNGSRAARAVIGGLPIALAIGWVAGEVTGCGRFAATCDASTGPLVVVAQLAVIGLLFVLPTIAAIASMATVVLLVTAVLVALALSAGRTEGSTAPDPRPLALGGSLVLAWFVGLGAAIWRRRGTLPASTGRAGPVS